MPLPERQLLNVVQEVSLAAGINPPYVCLLDQDLAINAFAAGYTSPDAVIGVTRGCLEKLNREQLQGVIGHECSHIVNGDMLLNMRTLIVLHGVFSFDIFGRWMLDIARYQWNTADNLEENLAGRCVSSVLLWLFGTAMILLGCLGTLCGLVISAAVSRQREFLADASAVELTRNPQGIAEALKIIGGYPSGTRVRSALAIEMNHMFFCPTTRLMTTSLMSHPPLDERIRRLELGWDGVPMFEDESSLGEVSETLGHAMQLVGGGKSAAPRAAAPPSDAPDDPSPCIQDHTDAAYLGSVGESIPAVLRELCEADQGCHLILLSIAMGDTARAHQKLSDDSCRLDATTQHALRAIQPAVEPLGTAQHFRLFDLALQRWVAQPYAQRSDVGSSLLRVLDGGPPNDWLAWGVAAQLRPHCRPAAALAAPRYGTYAELSGACETLLSALVYSGHAPGPTVEHAFRRAAVHFAAVDLHLLDVGQCCPADVDEALRELSLLSHRAKRSLLLAVSRSISADQSITPQEAALVRGICATLRVTVPRLIPGQPIAPGL